MFEISILLIAPFVGLMLLFWFKTDFVLEYGRLLGFKKVLAIDLYEKALDLNPNLTYQLFIAINYNRFFHRLINCPICLAVWLSILFTGAFAIFSGQYLILCTIPLSTILGIVIYLTIKKLL